MGIPELFGHWWDRKRRPMTFETWGSVFEEHLDYKRVAETDVLTSDGQLLWVSTVWVGIDMGYRSEGPPIIFETMIFEKEGGALDEYMERYSSEAAARDGHARFVRILRTMPLSLFDQLQEEL